MQVKVVYTDHSSLTTEEALANAKASVINGDNAHVEVSPGSSDPYSQIFFYVQKNYGLDISATIMDNPDDTLRKARLQALKTKAISDLDDIFEDVICLMEEGLITK